MTFDEILAASNLPPPGPEFYAARRKLWLTPKVTPKSCPPAPSSHRRLEKLLSTPNAVENDRVWKSGIGEVWKGLASGANLKRRLPMAIMIKIVHAAWLHDNTWPIGAIAPEPDDILPDSAIHSPILTECSGMPWTLVESYDARLGHDESTAYSLS